jgi:Protein of unknown function (DUF3995)
MARFVAVVLAAIFSSLALIHFYWALGGRAGKHAAVPEVGGRAAFVPSAIATFAVAIALTLCAWLVAACAGLVAAPLQPAWLSGLTFALSLALLARAIGDFRLVGFFKRVHGTRFAQMDSVLYAPLCLALAAAVFYVAAAYRA